MIYLNKMCSSYDESFLSLSDDLAWLSAVYLESRYPDDFEDIDRQDAEKALEIAVNFENFISKKFY
ncbi:MAG: HEPN domain-containing protein [Chitinophagaceae bacterium]|nr:HEPN domain-containing protein [Chitinophagaceae bacterium]